MSTAVLAPIVLDARGIAYIEGTRTKVSHVAALKQATGASPEELQRELPHLTLAQVYAALSYYYAHQEAIEAELQRDVEATEELRKAAGESPFARRMRAEGRLP